MQGMYLVTSSFSNNLILDQFCVLCGLPHPQIFVCIYLLFGCNIGPSTSGTDKSFNDHSWLRLCRVVVCLENCSLFIMMCMQLMFYYISHRKPCQYWLWKTFFVLVFAMYIWSELVNVQLYLSSSYSVKSVLMFKFLDSKSKTWISSLASEAIIQLSSSMSFGYFEIS